MEQPRLLAATLKQIQPADAQWLERAQARQLRLTKPPGSLGRLEEIANRLAAMQRTLSISAEKPRIVLFAADHGVCAEGVSPYPQEVTAQMVANFLSGGAAINAISRASGVELRIVDVGVGQEIGDAAGLIRRPVGRGTRNFCKEPAMSRDEAVSALCAGIAMAGAAAAEGCQLLGIGEMGIGNTTAASAMAAAITGLPVEQVVGRGTGADDACMQRKLSAVQRALSLHKRGIHASIEDSARGVIADPIGDSIDLLSQLGGFEIAAMTGACLGAAANRCAVVMDGFIATAAAAIAVRMVPPAGDYLIAAHRSAEAGHSALLDFMGQRPLLDLEMRLGEGTGAAVAIPLIRAAVAAFREMATFDSAGVSPSAASPAVSPESAPASSQASSPTSAEAAS